MRSQFVGKGSDCIDVGGPRTPLAHRGRGPRRPKRLTDGAAGGSALAPAVGGRMYTPLRGIAHCRGMAGPDTLRSPGVILAWLWMHRLLCCLGSASAWCSKVTAEVQC